MEEFQVEGEAQLGPSVFSWNAKGSEKFCDSVKTSLAETMQAGKGKNFTVSLSGDPKKSVIQICQDGKLLLNQTEGLEQFIVRDRNGKTIRNTNKNQGQLDGGLLDEENTKKEAERLQVGESITAVFSDASKLGVTFDQIITFASKIDESNNTFKLSQVQGGSLISRAKRCGFKKKSENKIELELTGKEIKMLVRVTELDKEGRRKLLAGLPIFDHIVLAANMDMPYFQKSFFSVCKKNLLQRIRDLLEKKDVSWFEGVRSCTKDRGKDIQQFIKILLNRITPRVLLEREKVQEVEFTLDRARVIVTYSVVGRRAEIIDIKSAKTIFTRDNAYSMKVTAEGTRAVVQYWRNNRAEIIDIKSEETIFTKNNVKSMEVTADGTRVIVVYQDKKAEIIDRESGKIIFTKNNVKSMEFTADGTMAIVVYQDKKAEIIDIKSEETIFKWDNVKSMQVTADGTMAIVKYCRNNRAEIIDIESGNTIFTNDDVSSMKAAADGSKVIVEYFSGSRAEIIDIESGETILTKDNVRRMEVAADGEKAIVEYHRNGRTEIVDIVSGNTILKRNNVNNMQVTVDGTRAIVQYNRPDNRKAEIIDIESGKVIFTWNDVRSMQVTADGSKVIVFFWNSKLKILDLESYDRGIILKTMI